MTHLFVISQKKSPFVVYDFDKDLSDLLTEKALKKYVEDSNSLI